MEKIDTILLEFVDEITGRLEERTAEFVKDKWLPGGLSDDVKRKIQILIQKRYGLDSIAPNDQVPDIQFDASKGVFIVNFEKTVEDHVTGKKINRIEIPHGVVMR